jgi:hypothetical protein
VGFGPRKLGWISVLNFLRCLPCGLIILDVRADNVFAECREWLTKD